MNTLMNEFISSAILSADAAVRAADAAIKAADRPLDEEEILAAVMAARSAADAALLAFAVFSWHNTCPEACYAEEAGIYARAAAKAALSAALAADAAEDVSADAEDVSAATDAATEDMAAAMFARTRIQRG